MNVRVQAVVGLVLAAAAAAVPATAIADAGVPGQVIAEVQRPTPISGYGHHVAFSAWDGSAFRLTVWDSRTGRTMTPDVRSRSVPFDVDLGPDRDGRTVAVYSRCSVEPDYDASFARSRWPYVRGRGCDVYRLDISNGRERRVTAAARKSFSEVLPTIWRDRIAFVRTPKGWREASRPQLRVTAPGKQMKMMTGGSSDFRTGPTKLDSYGRHLILEWETAPYRCSGPDEPSGSNFGNELWLGDVVRSKRTRIARFCSQDREPGVLRRRPTVGPLGLITIQSGQASDGAAGPSVTAAGIGSPERATPIAPVQCVDDVAQMEGAVVVVNQNGGPCAAEPQSFVVRIIG
jgi:hypothetical protein